MANKNPERDSWAFMVAAINNRPEDYGPMTEKQKKEFAEMVAWVKKMRAANPNVEFTLPSSYMDDDD